MKGENMQVKTDSYDPTDRYRFVSAQEAINYAKTLNKSSTVIELKDACYSDKPFMVVLNEWIKEAKVHG